jgi:hypothetical protein
VELGLFPSCAPLGYLDAKEIDKLGEKRLDPIRAPVIKQIFEKVAYEKMSGREILRWLRKINFRTPKGNFVSLSTIQILLTRTFYYGVFEYPHGSGNWYKGSHTPIITKDLYDQARGQIHYHRRGNKSTIGPFAFLRLMRCGGCGSGITAQEVYKPLKNGGTRVYRYYMCTHGKGDRMCRERYINEVDLISQLADMFEKIEIDLIGTKAQLEAEIEKWYRFDSFVTGESIPERSSERKEIDLRKYAKAIFEDGSLEEQREMLKNLKSRLIVKNKRVHLDVVTEETDEK